GGPRSRAVEQVLALVDAKVRGERVTKAALDRAAMSAFKASRGYGVHSPDAERAAYWAWDAAAKLGWMAATGNDNSELALTHAGYGWLDPALDGTQRRRAFDELHARSLAAARGVSAETIAKPPPRVDAR